MKGALSQEIIIHGPPENAGGESSPAAWHARADARQRERRAWELRVQGWTQERIALELNLSQSGVSRVLRRAEKRALAQTDKDVRLAKMRILGQLDHLLGEALAGWEKSKNCLTRKTIIRETDRGTVTDRVEITPNIGDPRFLKVALDAVSRQVAVLRLDEEPKPVQSDPAYIVVTYLPENGRGELPEVPKGVKSYAAGNSPADLWPPDDLPAKNG